jgi:hypothetical protein
MRNNGAPNAYSKVLLKPGGQLSVSGDVTAASNDPMSFQVFVYDDSQPHQLKATIATVTGVLAGSTRSFTSSTFTNTGATTATYYIVWQHGAANVSYLMPESNLTIHADTAKLTLFLNAHPDPQHPDLPDLNYFSVSNPNSTNDVGSYIPGAKLTDGTSLPLPTANSPIQKVQLIAAYLDEQGTIVAPPSNSVNFSLNNSSSAFQGVAMNWPDPRVGGDGSPDFVLEASSAAFDANDKTARVLLDCWDYGGLAFVTATDNVLTTVPVRLPQDANGNMLPDAGWKAGALSVADSGNATDDDDDAPYGNGLSGDNLSAFEEYRGFVVNGNHTRTHPGFKDVFISAGMDTFSDVNASDATGTGLWVHVMRFEEISETRQVNDHTGGGVPSLAASRQEAIIIFNGGVSSPGYAGATPCFEVPWECYPNLIGYNPNDPNAPFADFNLDHNVQIYYGQIRAESPPTTNSTIVEDPIDAEALREVIGHEIGHGVGVDHNTDQTSIMRRFVTGEDEQGQMVPWTLDVQIMHNFLPSDVVWLRVRP